MKVTEEMVARFLNWQLPKDFYPDCGITFKPPPNPNHSWPVGTNLLTAIQAKAMLEDVLACVPAEVAAPGWISVDDRLPPGDGWIEVIGLRDGHVDAVEYWADDKEWWPANGKGEYWAEKLTDVTHWMPMPQSPVNSR